MMVLVKSFNPAYWKQGFLFQQANVFPQAFIAPFPAGIPVPAECIALK
jgi:hypothetical protein